MLIPRLYTDNETLQSFAGGDVVCFFSKDTYAALLKLLPLLEYETLYSVAQIAENVGDRLISEIVDGEMTSDIKAGLMYLADVLKTLNLSDYVSLSTCCDAAGDTAGTAEDVATAETDAGAVGSVPVVQTGGVFDVSDCLAANVAVDAIRDIAAGMLAYIEIYGTLNDNQLGEVIANWLTTVGVPATYVAGAFVLGETVTGGTAAIVGAALTGTVRALVWTVAKFSDTVQPALQAVVDKIDNDRDTAVCNVYNGTDNWIIEAAAAYGQAVSWIVTTVIRGISTVAGQIGLSQFVPKITVDCSGCVSGNWSYVDFSGAQWPDDGWLIANGSYGPIMAGSGSVVGQTFGHSRALIFPFFGITGTQVVTNPAVNVFAHLVDYDTAKSVAYGQVGAYGGSTFGFGWVLDAAYDGHNMAVVIYDYDSDVTLTEFAILQP